jgi:hypothetical protein
MLVQVDTSGDHLDFHGQSGAVGRFEADEEGYGYFSCYKFLSITYNLPITFDLFDCITKHK